MDKIKILKEEFQKIKYDFGSDILKIMSSKTDDGKIFPPYIPFVGKKYNEYGILAYSTAQNIQFNDFRDYYKKNITKLTERLYYTQDNFKNNNFNKKYPDNKMSYTDIAIKPYQTGVIAALLGVFLYTKFNVIVKNLDDVNDMISISNYYKFSLNNRNNDINPEPTGKNKINDYVKDNDQIENYWTVNDNLVKKEIDTLNPKYILSFKGRKLKRLKQISKNKFQVVGINDPSWILQGGSGVFSNNGSWRRKANAVANKEVIDLIENYLIFLRGEKYKSKKESVKIYLLKYYNDWSK